MFKIAGRNFRTVFYRYEKIKKDKEHSPFGSTCTSTGPPHCVEETVAVESADWERNVLLAKRVDKIYILLYTPRSGKKNYKTEKIIISWALRMHPAFSL